ncbi:BppU family phage baseplate upper protein [Bacillus paranthracis]|uniref:BppU family phage baseplate upper protein n=1 Tax=Bacillus paranthracis TaxID=2026186 RepID=UPI0035560A98
MVNSIFKTYEVTVDTMRDSIVPQNMRYSQNDLKSAKILININHNGNEEDFSEATAVRVSFEKGDKKIVYQDCQPINVLEGKYQVLLTTQTLTSVGIVTANVHIYFPDDKKIETGSFKFEVVESKMSDEVIESTDSLPVIQKAIEAGEKLSGVDIPALVASKETAEQAKVAAEQNAAQIGILSQNVTDIMNHPTIVVQNQDPTAPKLGEIWISKGVNIIANGDFETATGSEWALSHGAANTANHVFAHERVTTQKVKGLYSLHISSNDPNYATSSANWNFSKAKQTVNKNLDRLLNFSCRVLVPSVEKYPAGTNAVRINLIVTAYGASGTLTSRKYQLYKSGGTSGDDIDLTSAVLMDNWSKVNINIIRDVIEKGVAWTDVKSVDLTFEAANNIGFYLDDISTF